MSSTAHIRSTVRQPHFEQDSVLHSASVQCHRSEAAVIESPAEQSWIDFCSTLTEPVMLLPGLNWLDS